MIHVIEVRQVVLVNPKRNGAECGVHIAHVVKQHAPDVVSDQRKAQLRRMEKHGIAADRESGLQIARSGLVVREYALRGAAAAEESLRQRDELTGILSTGHCKRHDESEFGVARQYQAAAYRVVIRAADQYLAEALPRAEVMRGEADIHRIENSAVCVSSILAPILNQASRQLADHGRLRIK